MTSLTFYTMDEVLAAGSSYTTFRTCLDDYANVKPAIEKIIGNYSDWFGLWLDTTDMPDAQITAAKISQVTRWTSYLRTKALYWNDYISRQSSFSGKQESISKFLDTPETETDYSGDTHVTNVSKSTTEADNALGLETLRPVIEMLVHDFRKTWLLPREAI